MGTERTQPRLFLVDGNSLFYRSFYAIQHLSNSKGFPTNAIYGFINTMKKLIAQEKPDYLGVVFDVKGPTVRHEDYKEYKANRKPMPEELAVQMPVLKEVLKAWHIPCIEYQSYEADDALATLAARAAGRDIHTVVVTTDKDLLQVVDKDVSVWNPAKEIMIGNGGVEGFFGVKPEQVADVLALWGDASDNIPGVPGIGEKTAKSLIKEFGSLDALLAGLDRVKNPRVRASIENNREVLDLSRRLVTVHRDLDLPLDLDLFAPKAPDEKEVIRLFSELEFTALLQDFVKKAPTPAGDADYRTILSEDELSEMAAEIRKKGALALDTETDNVSPTRANLVGISLSCEPGKACYIPVGHDYLGAPAQIPRARVIEILKPVLEDGSIRKTGQNFKYDWIVLKRAGLDVRGFDRDTMVLSYLLEPNWGRHNLEKLSLVYLHEQKTAYEDVTGRGKAQVTMDKAPVDRVAPYACQDADHAGRLGDILWDKVKASGLDRLYEEVERPLVELLARMEIWGVRVDPAVLAELSRGFEGDLSRLEKEIFEQAGGPFNINSPKQLSDILFHKLGLQPGRKTKGGGTFSTSVDVLEELAPLHPLIGNVLEYRQLSKLKSTYADALPLLIDPTDGRIHTSYNQAVTATGRLSSSDPNLQNIPARGEWGVRFRRAFVPEKGSFILAADYSQIELRILAHLSGDPALIETFKEGKDVHAETAVRVFGGSSILSPDEMRRRAKIINFSIIYGTSAFSLAKELGTSNGEAQAFIDRYFAQYPQVSAYLEDIVRKARETGFSETILGRKRQVPELAQSDKNVQQAGRRIALNTPIQGSAADIIKLAMLRIWDDLREKKLATRMILQVHDELLFEVPEREKGELEALVRDRMENAYPLSVPLTVKIGTGRNWAEAK